MYVGVRGEGGEAMKFGTLRRGTLVEAVRHLDLDGANVPVGEKGVVFEESNAYGDGAGPMVRWFSGGCCNVYAGQIAILHKPTVWNGEDTK